MLWISGGESAERRDRLVVIASLPHVEAFAVGILAGVGRWDRRTGCRRRTADRSSFALARTGRLGWLGRRWFCCRLGRGRLHRRGGYGFIDALLERSNALLLVGAKLGDIRCHLLQPIAVFFRLAEEVGHLLLD